MVGWWYVRNVMDGWWYVQLSPLCFELIKIQIGEVEIVLELVFLHPLNQDGYYY